MSKENPNPKSKKLEKALFVAGVAAGALMGARGLIVQKSNEVLLGFKSKWSLQRLPASGEAAVDECSLEVATEGAVSWQRMRYRSGNCSLMIRPSVDRVPGRTFSFGSNGAIMVFSQFGANINRESGAQLYFLFPRAQNVPSASVIQDLNEVAIRTGAGALIRFSTETGDISRTSADLAIDQASSITESNRGGITITHWSGILLDVGFSMREQPYYRRPNGTATFRDSSGAVCRVRNSDIFDYTYQEEPRFRLVDDELALAFLREKCANLDLSSLQPTRSEGERATSVEAAPIYHLYQQRAAD